MADLDRETSRPLYLGMTAELIRAFPAQTDRTNWGLEVVPRAYNLACVNKGVGDHSTNSTCSGESPISVYFTSAQLGDFLRFRRHHCGWRGQWQIDSIQFHGQWREVGTGCDISVFVRSAAPPKLVSVTAVPSVFQGTCSMAKPMLWG